MCIQWSSLLSRSEPSADKDVSPTWLLGSDHIPCMCIGVGGGNGGEAFWNTGYQMEPQQPPQTGCVPSPSNLQVLTTPQQEALSLFLFLSPQISCTIVNISNHWKLLNLKTQRNKQKPRTILMSPRGKRLISFWGHREELGREGVDCSFLLTGLWHY